MSEKCSLYIDNIDQAANEFIEKKPSYAIYILDKQDGKLKQIKITHQKKTGILNCFITGGQVSHNIQGSTQLKSICDDCWNYIVQNTSIPCHDIKVFKVNEINPNDFDIFIGILSEREDLEINAKDTKNNDKIRNHYILKGKYGAKISIILYFNGTLLIQGRVTSFFLEVITEAMGCFSSYTSNEMEELLSIQPMVTSVVEEDLSKCVQKIEHISGSRVEGFLKSSIALVNSGVRVDDYGCYSFGILKAIDFLLAERIMEDAPCFKNYGDYFVKVGNGRFHILSNIIIFDNNLRLKGALEKAYNFYHTNRHTTFHVDYGNLETSRILTYDDAVSIVREGLDIINEICNNW